MVGRMLTVGAATLAMGCATEEGRLLSEEPGYAAGFGDGCSTGQEEGKSFSTERTRDAYRFENERAYRAGWRQGYLECKGYERPRNNGGVVLGNEERL